MSALSSAEPSPSQSPSLGPTRRLSSRRGSISASDPWGAHASVNLNPSRSSSSRLTIVRVPQAGEQQDGRNHRRHGSNASVSSTSSKGESTRLSFAFTSFTPINREGGRPGSPGSSPRLRPSSPSFASGSGAGLSRSLSTPHQHSKLSPEKLVELARTSCNPRITGPAGPGQFAPVSFTALADDVYLPFVDRPVEVTSLISVPPSSKLFALLAQTFPPEARASADEHTLTPSPDSDAHAWRYAQLEAWLKRVPREDVDDAGWVRKARHCILPRSELIWERIKGALGIPPELDTDDPIGDPLAAYLGLPAPPVMPTSMPINVPRGLTSQMLDSDVFEPDSPAVSVHGGGSVGHATNTPPSPVTSELELSIEPVLATAPPPPSIVDPTTGANMTSLHELREEDENDEGDEGSTGSAGSPNLLDAAVQGLRISTSASISGISPVLGAGRGGASPSPQRLAEGEYDALNERGPGHPLFPSNFAHLSLAPTLRAGGSASNSRSNSMSYPPLPAAGLLRRTDSNSSTRLNPRPDWARGWDIAKHEDAVTTSSVSGME